MGEGNWDLNTYWQVNHQGKALALEDASGNIVDVTSRYRVYRYEIEHRLVRGRETVTHGSPPPLVPTSYRKTF